jgi:hypothetical protein
MRATAHHRIISAGIMRSFVTIATGFREGGDLETSLGLVGKTVTGSCEKIAGTDSRARGSHLESGGPS